MMDKEEIEKEGLRSMKEFDIGWTEFFRNKPEPKNDEEDLKQQQEFYHWYNYVRKQSDTGKTPAEMYKEAYGEDPKNVFDEKKPSRFMNFEWDNYDDKDFEEDEEKRNEELIKLAEEAFENGVWQDSKEHLKDMSKREVSRHMFSLGFLAYADIIENELENMPKEDVQKMIDNFKEKRENKKDE